MPRGAQSARYSRTQFPQTNVFTITAFLTLSLSNSLLLKFAQDFAATYIHIATTVKSTDPSIIVGRVDATVEKSIPRRYSADGWPTLMWFENGEMIAEFPDADLIDELVVEWVERLLSGVADEITSIEQLTAEMEFAGPRVVVGYFTSGIVPSAFKKGTIWCFLSVFPMGRMEKEFQNLKK